MEKWSYQYNADTIIKEKLEDILFTKRFRSLKETLDYVITKTHEEVIECTEQKNSTNI